MDIQSNSRDIATPLSFKNLSFYKPEDSGYQTSFATSSLECSSTPSELQDPSLLVANICQIKFDCYPITPRGEVTPLSGHYNSFNPSNSNSSNESTPLARRGVKRRHDEGQKEVYVSAVATPTSLIANEVQKLRVNDSKTVKTTSFDSGHIDTFVGETYSNDYFNTSEIHPSTPIKKICRDNCNLSPFNRRKSPRKVDFAIHSLSCEKEVLKVQPKLQTKEVNCNKFKYKPNQKFDIIKTLYRYEGYCSPSIKKILGYLSKEDVFHFTLVSPVWCNIFKNVNTKQTFKDFYTTVKNNLENWDKVETPKFEAGNNKRSLKEIQNFNLMPHIPHSPTRSPRTTRFNKFIKVGTYMLLQFKKVFLMNYGKIFINHVYVVFLVSLFIFRLHH